MDRFPRSTIPSPWGWYAVVCVLWHDYFSTATLTGCEKEQELLASRLCKCLLVSGYHAVYCTSLHKQSFFPRVKVRRSTKTPFFSIDPPRCRDPCRIATPLQHAVVTENTLFHSICRRLPFSASMRCALCALNFRYLKIFVVKIFSYGLLAYENILTTNYRMKIF